MGNINVGPRFKSGYSLLIMSQGCDLNMLTVYLKVLRSAVNKGKRPIAENK